jgi:hypothetical protein
LKNSKALIAVLCAIVLIFSLAACAQQKAKTEKVTQVVTNESGEAVTGENGELITEEVEAQIITDANGKAVTEIVTGQNGQPLTTVVNNSYVNVTQVVTSSKKGSTSVNKTLTTKKTTTKKSKSAKKTTQISTEKSTTDKAQDKPENISSLTVSDIKEDSLKLNWSNVSCTGYQIAISGDAGQSWEYLEKEYTKNTYTVKNLISNTDYAFRVRAYNKDGSGTAASEWKQVNAKTKANTDKRKIKIIIELPIDGDAEDVLTVTIDGKEIKKGKVKLDGSKYSFTTEEKYKGEVEINASLADHGSDTVKTDKDECVLSLPLSRIPLLIDDED